jgi:nicotinamidase-related amidase
MRYPAGSTAVLLVDPYNDFLSEGGKSWPRLKDVAATVDLLDHLRAVVAGARQAGIRIFFVPHRRYEDGDYEHWTHATPYQRAGALKRIFERGSWGGAFHPDFQPRDEDVVVHEHWGTSGFANTDLDMQLKQYGIGRVILIGLIANTCIEATGRFAMELGYHVTLVKDATAAFTEEAMHSAHEINGPTYAHAIITTDELLTLIGEPAR